MGGHCPSWMMQPAHAKTYASPTLPNPNATGIVK